MDENYFAENNFDFGNASSAVTAPPMPAPDIVTDDAPPAARAAPSAPTPLETANAARETVSQALRSLVWIFPDGSRKVPLLTSSRWCLYEALRGKIGADEGRVTVTREQASQEAYRRRYVEAGLLLFLCFHPASTWEAPRRQSLAGRTVEIEPLEANFSDFLRSVNRWIDEAIPIPRLPDAVAMAEALADGHWSAAVIARPSDDPDAVDDETAEKKTPAPTGLPSI